MDIREMNCCAFNEIHDLRSCRTAQVAMQVFCQLTLQALFGFDTQHIGAFYIFTAVVKSTPRDGTAGAYGANFAKFITKNNLGVVVQTGVRDNRRNVPNHSIRGWVWAPNEKRLKAWWKKNGGGRGE